MIYCDYIAHLIQQALVADRDDLLEHVGHTRLELDITGALAGSKKTIEVDDIHGTKYRVTIEALPQ
jgi:hypothetical protein